jgi:hypothetical protein
MDLEIIAGDYAADSINAVPTDHGFFVGTPMMASALITRINVQNA